MIDKQKKSQEKYWEEDIITYDKTECSEEFLSFYFILAEGITFLEMKSIGYGFNTNSDPFLYSVFCYKESSGYENKYELKHLLTDNEANEIKRDAQQYEYEKKDHLLIFKIPIKKKIKKVYE